MSTTINYIGIPKALPVRFVQLGGVYNPQYHFPQFDATWFQLMTQSWQNAQYYNQKIQFNDLIQLQFHANNAANGSSIKLIDCNGNILFTWSPIYTHTFAGNIATITLPAASGNTSITLPLTTYHFKFSLYDVTGLASGNYLLLFTAPYTDGSQAQAVSEPITIAADFPNTLKFEYFNSTNKRDLFFIQPNALFGFRTEGWMDEFVPFMFNTQYNDMGYDTTLVDSIPYRKFKLEISGLVGAPNWVFDKVNRALSCDNLFIDQFQYSPDEGATWSMNPFPKYNMQAGSIIIRETKNTESSIASNINPIPIFTASPGFLVGGVILTDAFGNAITLTSSVIEIRNTSDLNNLIASYNGSISINNNLKGYFYYSSGTLYYQNAVGEYWVNATVATLFVKSVILNFQAGSATIAFTGHTSGTTYVSYRDGTITSYVAGASVSYGNLYSDSGAHAAFLYHKDNISTLTINDANFNSITGTMPTTLTSFIAQGTALTTFDASVFVPCKTTLAELQIKTGVLTSCTNLNQNFTALATISFFDNTMPVTAVDNVFNDFYLGTSPITHGGTFNTQSQTPAAPPTSVSVVSRIQLASTYSWTITTD